METILKWNLRTRRENPRHTLITVLNLVFNFSLLFCTDLIINVSVSNKGTDGDGILWYIAMLLETAAFLTSALTLYSSFAVTIRERESRYRHLYVCGATKRQIRQSLVAEATLLCIVGAVLGFAMGGVLFAMADMTEPDTDEIVRYMMAPTRRLLFATPEFLIVPAVMELAAFRFLPETTRDPVPRKPEGRKKNARRFGVRQTFGFGGALSRLLHKREKHYRTYYLIALVMCITMLIVVDNVFNILQDVSQSYFDDVTIRTSGEHAKFERDIDALLDDPEFRALHSDVFSFRVYIPCAYCFMPDAFASPDVLRMRTKSVLSDGKQTVRVYPDAQNGRSLILPQMLFLQDDQFDKLAQESGVHPAEDEAILMQNLMYKGKPISWMQTSDGAAALTLRFYTGQTRYEIGTEAEEKAENARREHNGTPEECVKIGQKADVQAYLRTVQPLSGKTVRVRIAGAASGATTDWMLRCVDRRIPTLLFPERARARFLPLIANAYGGRHVTLTLERKVKVADSDAETLKSIRKVACEQPKGYIAEHPFGKGTRYIGNTLGRDSQNLTPPVQFPLAWVSYDPPRPLLADLYPSARFALMDFNERAAPLFLLAFSGMTLFALFTNIVNVVYANHALRRRDYAMLESIGMDAHQKRNMVVYESVRYTLRSVLFSILGFLLTYPSLSYTLSYGLQYEHLELRTASAVEKTASSDVWWIDALRDLRRFGAELSGLIGLKSSPAEKTGYFWTDAADALRSTVNICLSSWWRFLIAGVSVFLIFLLTNLVVRRHMKSGDTIQLLKKES
ncbi:MAG: hypothetical protein IJT44_01525 [Clostridia bacterium]|nr:hypothetical protein [Clostridia bacterium]